MGGGISPIPNNGYSNTIDRVHSTHRSGLSQVSLNTRAGNYTYCLTGNNHCSNGISNNKAYIKHAIIDYYSMYSNW